MTNSADHSRKRQTPDEPRSELLSRAYRDALEDAAVEPAGSVDDAVRAAAHQAVESRPPSNRASGLRAAFRRWRTPLALAATLLLAIGIALRAYKTGDVEIPLARPPTETQSSREEIGANKLAEKPQPKVAEERRTNEPIGTHPSRDAAPSSGEKPAPNKEIATDAALSRKDLRPPEQPARTAERKRGAASGTAQAPQPETQAEPPEARYTAEPFPGAPGALTAPPPTREPTVAPRATAPSQDKAPALRSAPHPLRERMERMEQERPAAPARTSVQLIAQRLEGRPADVWVEEIRTLKRAGRAAEAAELLAALRKKFPDFVLPDDLK